MADIINVMTNAGASMVAAALAGQTVSFEYAVFGTDCFTGDAIMSQAVAKGIMKNGALGRGGILRSTASDGKFVVGVSYTNAQFTGASTMLKQVGVYAKTASMSDPVLFSYLSFGDYGSSVFPARVQIVTRTFDIPFAFSAQGGSMLIVPSGYIDASQTAESGEPGKLVYCGSDGKLDADIKGDAATVGGKSADDFATATHSHAVATTSANGFMSAAQVKSLNAVFGRVDQDLTKTAQPTFAGLTVNGVIRGARFE